jgi:hypothetical protein
MKYKVLIVTITSLGLVIVVLLGLTFRWLGTKNGYQELTYVKSEIPPDQIQGPHPDQYYYYSDAYLVTYAKGKWPHVIVTSKFQGRVIVDQDGAKVPMSILTQAKQKQGS